MRPVTRGRHKEEPLSMSLQFNLLRWSSPNLQPVQHEGHAVQRGLVR